MRQFLALFLSLLISLPWSALAAEGTIPGTPSPGIILEKNQVAPGQGAFFSDQAAISLLEALRDLGSFRDRLLTLQKELDSKDSEIGAYEDEAKNLEEARRQTAIGLAKAEFIIQNWEMIQKSMLLIVDEHRKVNATLKEANDQLMQALKDTRNELFWTKIFGVLGIVGIVASTFIK